MKFENKYYSCTSISTDKIDYQFLSLSTLNGEITALFKLENRTDGNSRVLSLLSNHLQFYFERQYYNNTEKALREAITNIGRQIHLEAMHDENLFGATFSLIITLIREVDMVVYQTGNLDFKQTIWNSSSNSYEFKSPKIYNDQKEFLTTSNFNDITLRVYTLRLVEESLFVMSGLTFFEDSIHAEKLHKISFETKNQIELEKSYKSITTHPLVIIKIKSINLVHHKNDTSLFKQVLNLTYFQNIPSVHLVILAVAFVMISLIIYIFKPEKFVEMEEEKAFELIKAEEYRDIKLLEQSFQSKKIEKSDSNSTVTLEPEKKSIINDTVAIYVVDTKENLFRISKNFNVSIDTLSKLNNLKNNTIYPNQKITVPVMAIYTTNKSETVLDIAKQFNIKASQIENCNKLKNTVIKEGTQILIPFPNEN